MGLPCADDISPRRFTLFFDVLSIVIACAGDCRPYVSLAQVHNKSRIRSVR